jgi:Icc-related predicted phosphoesterase
MDLGAKRVVRLEERWGKRPIVHTIFILGDVHDHQERLEVSLSLLPAEKVDLALLAGDVGLDPPWLEPARHAERGPHDESVRQVVQQVGKLCSCPVVFVPGNHDLNDPPGDVDGTNVDGRTERVAGLRIAGLGGSGPAPYGFPYEWSESQAHSRLAAMFDGSGKDTDIFLCHAPPANTRLDVTARGDHVGSRSVYEWIGRIRPKLFVCGHIHEAWGLEWVQQTPCLNAGALGEPHGQVIAWFVEWDHGPLRIRSVRQEPGGEPVWHDWHPRSV